MSTSSQAQNLGQQGSSDTSPGFRSFWRKSKQAFSERSPDSAQSGDSRSKKGSKASRTDSTRGAVSKRRQQVYQAQKRHRDRKAEYLRSLEEEVARLQKLDALVNSQRNILILQNQAFRDYFAAEAAALPFLDTPASRSTSTGPSPPGSAEVAVRFDAEIEHERTFLNLSETDGTQRYFGSTSPFSQGSQTTAHVSPQPAAGATAVASSNTSCVALDFILALEWPCKDHHAHEGINPIGAEPHNHPPAENVDPNALHGHALTMTAAVYQSAQPIGSEHDVAGFAPSSVNGADAQSKTSWQIPHSEIDKLVQLSEGLALDEDQTTPAQAYAYVKQLALSDGQLQSVLRALKPVLSPFTSCHGFGATIPTSVFLEQVTRAMYGSTTG